MSQAFKVKIENGKMTFTDRKHFDQFLKNKTGYYILTVETSRTEAQRKLYFHFIHLIATETGEDPDRVHNELKKKFINGASTTSLTPAKFIWYIEKIRVFMAQDFNIYLPDPKMDNYPQGD